MYSAVEMDIILLNISFMFRLGFVGIHDVYQIRLKDCSRVIRLPERSTRKQVESNIHISIFHLLASGPEDSFNIGKTGEDGKPKWL
jgi:hypothetical protein